MSSAPIKVHLHIGDYLRDTEELSLLQHGVYFRLMMAYYSSGQPLPNDIPRLCRRIQATSHEERAAVEAVLVEFFRLEGPVWMHKRIEEELAQWHTKTVRAQTAADARWNNKVKENNKTTHADALQTHGAKQCLPYPVSRIPCPVSPPALFPDITTEPDIAARKARGSRLKVEKLPEPWKAFCMQERVGLDPAAVFAEFRDYWIAKPGQGGVKLDWDATWRNWVRRQSGPKGPQAGLPAAARTALCDWRGDPYQAQATSCGAPNTSRSGHYGGRALCEHHARLIEDKAAIKTKMPDDVRNALAGLVRKVTTHGE